jgi:hypothetical protein
MRLVKFFVVSCFAFCALSQIDAQGNANKLLRDVYRKLHKAKDYSVQANIKVDMPLIRILPVDVTIYYKQKDKFKVDSKSITVVPRQGFDQIPKMIGDTNSYTAMLQGDEVIGVIKTKIVNIIPLSDTSDLIFAKVWIDPKQNVIMKSQLTTRSSGTIVTEYVYGSQLGYGLPDQMIFLVDANKFRIPKVLTEGMSKKNTDNQKDKEVKKGKILIALSNYQINKGIPDEVFSKK